MSRSSRRRVRPSVEHATPPLVDPHRGGNESRPIEGSAGGYRLLRRIASGDRADVYLATVDPGDEPDRPEPDTPPAPRPLVALRVYDATASDAVIATEIEVMASDASGSTPALVDVAALDDGRTCLAVERIAGPPLAQLLGERSFLAGEAVTVLAPIAQAVREFERRGFVHTRLSAADVLLDERGRPRIVGLGSVRRLAEVPAGPDRVALLRAGEAALLRLVEDVAAATIPAGALAACEGVIRSSLDRRPFETCGEQLERALFEVAPAAPISGVAGNGRASAVPARVSPAALTLHRPADEPGPGAGPGSGALSTSRLRQLASLAQLPEQFVDEVASAADGFSTRALRGRVAAIVSSRRRQLVVGGGAGAAMLAVLLTLVPPGATASMTESGSPVAEAASAAPSAQAGPPAETLDTTAVGAEVAPVAAAAELLEVRASCLAARDVDCIGTVAQAGSPIAASDRAAMLAGPADDDRALDALDLGAITLVADMGSAVLLEVPYAVGEREPASLLMMRSEAGWRLRELFD